MTTDSLEDVTEVLQQLGLQEYEARCFVGLSWLDTGTAKQLSEVTEVPRTRVYDAIRMPEAQGLVEIQHSSPQQFRAVPLDEATHLLQGGDWAGDAPNRGYDLDSDDIEQIRDQFTARTESLLTQV